MSSPIDSSVAARVIIAQRVRAEHEVAYELASVLGSAVHVLPAGEGVAVVPDGPTVPATWWPQRMRPVLDLIRFADGSVRVEAFMRVPQSGRRLRGKLAAATSPTLTLDWRPSAAGADPALAPVSDQSLESLVEALSLEHHSAVALTQLLRTPHTPPSSASLVTALELAPTVTALLDGVVRVSDLPQAVAAPHLGPWATIRESLLARPLGSSLVARMRRWDHDRPALSILTIITAGSLASFALLYPFPDQHLLADGWPRGVWLAAGGLLAFDAVGSLVVLAAIRRRIRRTPPDQ